MTLLGSQDTGLGNVDTASAPAVADGGGGTLASIYAAGLADFQDDNLFGMPAGNLRFPGYTDFGSRSSSAIEYYQDKSLINLSEPPGYELVSMAFNNSGSGGNGCGAFRIDELNDPAWNGSFASISGGVRWNVEEIALSNDVDETKTHSNSVVGGRIYDFNAESPFTWPDTSRTSIATAHTLSLYNGEADADLDVQSISGFGEEQKLLRSASNGANAQWITHWDNEAASEEAGDGPAWIVDSNGGGFGHVTAAVVFQAYQLSNLQSGGWGWRFYARDSGGTMNLLLDLNDTAATFSVPVVAPP